MPTRVKRAVQKEISLIKLEKPMYLSVVGSPANRTGFKVIRKDSDGNTRLRDLVDVSKEVAQSRSDSKDSALLSLSFPEGLTRAEVEELVEAFGMADEYEVREDAGRFIAYRRNSPEGTIETVDINTGYGYTATLVAQRFSRSDPEQIGVTLVGLEFGESFTEDSVNEWLARNEVQVAENGIEVCEGGIAVTRHVLPDDGKAHVRKVEVETGVSAIIAATQRNDVPVKLYRSVVEQAYGNYGWGHLNFASALVDPAFTDTAWDAIYVLREVLENIILYSGLPLEDRKQLMRNALAQFGAFLEQMMDSLPKETMDKGGQRGDSTSGTTGNPEPEVRDMTTQNTNTGSAPDQATGDQNGGSPDQDFVTRSDLTAAVGAAIKEQLAPAVTEAVTAALSQRNDGTPGDQNTGDQSGGDSASGDAGNQANNAVLEAINTMRTELGARMDKVEADMKEMAESTVVHRSDDEDGNQQSQGEGAGKRNDGGPFSGMFNRSFGLGQ